ncbi:MAG TPA: hypothetical protein EYP86_03155 [Candidatus Altiarchaeales archaeon]|nr:hypothetical protein [Candidatus Altiarchaeales archaeon]
MDLTNLLMCILLGIILVVFFYLFCRVVKKLFINSITGLVLLFILKYVFMIDIPIEQPAVLIVTALFGLAGVGSLLILKLGGLI